MDKCIQLFETTVVRHGLMLVGPTCSGKTKCYEILGDALTQLKGQPSIAGGTYEEVHVSFIFDICIPYLTIYGIILYIIIIQYLVFVFAGARIKVKKLIVNLF